MEAYVKNYCEGNIGFLEFGNPAGNSLPSPLLKAFKAGLIALEKDSNVRVIVIPVSYTHLTLPTICSV